MSPSTNGSNGRGQGGRFGRGNPGGPGNPFAKRANELRALMLDAVTDEDLRCILQGLVARAKAGDAVATREVLDRVLGRSVQAIAPDARVGTATEPEHESSGPDFVARVMRTYAELGVPRVTWSPMVSAPYERWLADERHPDRPFDFPEIAKQVRERCDGWGRVKPLLNQSGPIDSPHQPTCQ
jgi:hypothetical protein